MANLTIAVDEELLRRARIRALELDTSVNAFLREKLEEFVSSDEVATARREIAELARDAQSGGAASGRTWTREELYEERLKWPRS
ncbi:MAG: hypothetical protein WDA03_12855 [Trueperaceae bacterium]